MIHIAYPWLILSLVLPFIIYKLSHSHARQASALKVPFFKELSQLFGTPDAIATKSLNKIKYLLALTWLLIVLSAMGFQWLGQPISIPQNGRDLLMAIDLSGSMQTPDMQINGVTKSRIDLVKQVAKQFINGRSGDRLGLVLFGSKPYLQTPLTFDRETVQDMLDDASIGIAGTQTAIGDAIGLSIKQIINYPANSKAIILLTDGGNNAGVLEPLAMAKLAKKQHIKIYTIGIGAKQMTVQTLFGPQVINPSSDLDINGLKQIALTTGGKFFRAEDGRALQNIYNQINQLEPISANHLQVRPITQLYPWTLGSALLLSFIIILILLIRRVE